MGEGVGNVGLVVPGVQLPSNAGENGTATRATAKPEALMYSIPEAAAVLRVSTRTFWRMVGDGSFGPAVIHFGQRRLARVRVEELRGWINDRCPPARRWKWRAT